MTNFSSSFNPLIHTLALRHIHKYKDRHTNTQTHRISQHFWYRNLFAKWQMSSSPSGPMFDTVHTKSQLDENHWKLLSTS